MSEKSQLFAFVVGEVAPEFFGRSDLAKYPLSLEEAENFFIDYKGGIVNRPGTEFIVALPEQHHAMFRFRAAVADYTLFFTGGKMRVARGGGFILTGAATSYSVTAGHVGHPDSGYAAGKLVYVAGRGYYFVSDIDAAGYRLADAFDRPLPNGSYTMQPVYELVTPWTGDELDRINFYQDLNEVVVSLAGSPQRKITYLADDNWTVGPTAENLPTPPANLTAVASGEGEAAVSYVVTVVVNGVESMRSVPATLNNIVNFGVTTGHVDLSWDHVPGAEAYYVYRTLLFPKAPFKTGAQYAYLGRTNGLAYQDANGTLDFTKTLQFQSNFFDGNNGPGLYCRFQQRGFFAGMPKSPLDIVSSVALSRHIMSQSEPPIASDSIQYTLDAETTRPIKHMIPLRYGLMLFTDDVVAQLRGGGDNKAISATNAYAETQAYTSVSDMKPVAINMDLMYMTSLHTEFNAMLYTEYTNSFKPQNVMVLSSHLFGPDNQALSAEYAAEPNKLIHLIREDGQRCTLTYAREDEVFGWARHRTMGEYLKQCVVREDKFNFPYYTVSRYLNGKHVMCFERERPRISDDYSRTWFLDCAVERPLIQPSTNLYLYRDPEDDGSELMWYVEGNVSWAAVDTIVYIRGTMFRVHSVNEGSASLYRMSPHTFCQYYDQGRIRVKAWEWGYNTEVYSIGGLWHLEGQTVSVQVDGKAYVDYTVEGGSVSFPTPGARVLVGLPYRARAKTPPLTLPNATLDGRPLALRGIVTRVLDTRGLKVGAGYDDLEELNSFQHEPWGSPQTAKTGLVLHNPFGGKGFAEEAAICFQQDYPLPCSVLGVAYNLDVGED